MAKTSSRRKKSKHELPLEASNEVAREIWVSRLVREGGAASIADARQTWMSDESVVRETRKAVRLGLFRLANKGIFWARDEAPVAEDVVNEIAREIWIAQYWQQNPELSYRDANTEWARDTDRVRLARIWTREALGRLRGARIGFVRKL